MSELSDYLRAQKVAGLDWFSVQSIIDLNKKVSALTAEHAKQSALLAQMAATLRAITEMSGPMALKSAQAMAALDLTAYATMSPDPQWQRVPEGCVVIRKDLVDAFPELNMSNYSEDDVRALNNWGIEVALYDPFQRARREG